MQPQPNTVTTFAVDIPVERNTIVRDPGDPGERTTRSGGGPGQCVPGPGPGGPGTAGLRSQNGAVANGRALIDLVCNGNTTCTGLLELLNPSARAALTNAKKAGRFGKQSYEIAGGTNAIVSVKLNRKAKRFLRRNGALAVVARLTPTGGTPITGSVLLAP